MYSKEELANDFRKLGVRAADTVMLQASARAAGKVAGGPDYIHLALKIVFSRRSSTVFSLRRGTTAPEWEKP
jgi:aminoglycoside N3'-acetyltransferase